MKKIICLETKKKQNKTCKLFQLFRFLFSFAFFKARNTSQVYFSGKKDQENYVRELSIINMKDAIFTNRPFKG